MASGFRNTKIAFFLGVVLFRVLLDWIYINSISAFFEYYGFFRVLGSHYFYSWVIFLVFTLFVLKFLEFKDWFTSNVIILLFLLRLVPTTSIMGFMPMGNNFLMLECLFWGCLFLFGYFFPTLNIRKVRTHSNFFTYFFFYLFAAVIVFISGYYTGFRLNFTFENVYDLRAESREFEIPTMLRYLWAAGRNIMPLLFIYFLDQKKRKMSVLTAILIFMDFSINGLKSTIFRLFITLIAYFFYKKRIIYSYPWYFVILCFIVAMERVFLKSISLSDMIIRRVLYAPPLLDYYYYDYISHTSPVYFSNPNNLPIPYIIGNEYITEGLSANNGLFSDAYTNMGGLGCIVFPFLIVLLCKLFSAISKNIDQKMLILPVIMIVFTLNSSFFTVALATHGIFLMLVFLYFMKTSRN